MTKSEQEEMVMARRGECPKCGGHMRPVLDPGIRANFPECSTIHSCVRCKFWTVDMPKLGK